MARSIHTFWCERPGPLMILERRKHEGQILTSGGGKRAQTSSTPPLARTRHSLWQCGNHQLVDQLGQRAGVRKSNLLDA
eukprot:scaffold3219_cov105-Isochrysis_galbana.AAC.5